MLVVIFDNKDATKKTTRSIFYGVLALLEVVIWYYHTPTMSVMTHSSSIQGNETLLGPSFTSPEGKFTASPTLKADESNLSEYMQKHYQQQS